MKKEPYPFLIMFVLLIVAGIILGVTLFNTIMKNPSVTPPKPVEAMELTSADCDNPLCYIRRLGQEKGYDDFTISKFIRIARAESGFDLNPLSRNPNSTATGIYQFLSGTFHAYCKGMNIYDFKDNIECFYKVLEKDGYPKGLNHWASSKSKWLY